MTAGAWKIWVDTGGTFTDCIGISPKGEYKRLKILSSSVLRGKITGQPGERQLKVQLSWPVEKDIFAGYRLTVLTAGYQDQIRFIDIAGNIIHLNKAVPPSLTGLAVEISSGEEVPVLAARLLTETSLGQKFPALEMKLGSTRGTNAILERKGAKTALVVTRGFRDLLSIGNQQRPDLFALHIQKEIPLYHSVTEVEERIESDGAILIPLQEAAVQALIQKLKSQKIESVAIALLNSYRNPSHEIMLKESIQQSGIEFVSASHELSGQIKILPRAETAVANAYLAPIIRHYVSGIRNGLSGADLKIMTSAGSLVHAENFYPKDSLLSGPAGGVVGAATSAKLSGQNRIIAFDMGGTSTDVSLYDKRYDYRYESKVAGLKILSPSLSIETIAAGGGSICDFDGYRFTVGPHSAGASPGPACYGAGGPLTITDVNLLLGRIDTENFSIPLHRAAAEEALRKLLARVKKASGKTYRGEAVMESLIQIANEKMGEAIRKVSVQLGRDPREFSLLSFGGAGGQHAIALANLLGMDTILVPYDAGLLSAFGIGHASVEHFEEQLVLKPLTAALQKLPGLLEALYERGKRHLQESGYPAVAISLQKQLLFLRFRGQESTIEVEYVAGTDVQKTFRKKYKSVFGHWLDQGEIELESIRVMVALPGQPAVKKRKIVSRNASSTSKKQLLYANGQWNKVSLFRWEDLKPGAVIKGPAVMTSRNSTTVVDKGWRCFLNENNHAMLKREKRTLSTAKHSKEATLELFTNRFTGIAQEMGALLQRTSFSVNVKERLDFSCALLDRDGYLVVNAPHIPVHLGSLGVCVREVLKAKTIGPGDVIITNHPAFGGSHLPDVTLIKAVFVKGKRVGFVANRAHHAEIGGKKPGSMPADAATLEEEGVIISPTWLVKGGVVKWESIKTIFSSARYPSRLLQENLADLMGALAAVNFGEKALGALCALQGEKEVTRNMKSLRDYAGQLLRDRLKKLGTRTFKATEKLDDGSILTVQGKVRKGALNLDFKGSAPVHAGNLNATKAIVQSAILYTLRLLVDKSIPMNEGLMSQVKVHVPHGLLDPFSQGGSPDGKKLPAVVGGNTEVSQRLTDTLLKAFHLAACSQGTMNNFLFGNERFGYYETICGGTGAGPGFNGADAVHQHMTNTRITDPELLELRYPVRLEKFEIRKNSGGRGRWKGGEGVIRSFYFKESLEISFLSQHRKERPYGMEGGEPGRPGLQHIERTDGTHVMLKGADSARVNKGDTLVFETPGGGGWGKAQ